MTTTNAVLESTDRRCLECGDLSEDLTSDPCEECGEVSFEFVHRSDTPLGRDDDDDCHIAAGPGRAEVWEYLAEEPE